MFTKLLSDIAGKIVVGICIALFLVCTFLYLRLGSKEVEISKLSNTVSELSNRNSVLESQVENCKIQFEAAMTAKKIQQDVIDKLNDNDQKTLDELNKLNYNIESKKDAENSDSGTPLSPDLIRVLERHCNQVRGEACPNP